MATAPQISAYTNYGSISSQICRVALDEHGLKFHHVHVDIHREMENHDLWFARLQPKMIVPCMKYNNILIGDSQDICYFLAEKHPEFGLYPADKKDGIDKYIHAFYDRYGSVAAFTYGHMLKKNPGMKATLKSGKESMAIEKLKKLVQEPDLKEVVEAKLAQKTSGHWGIAARAESIDLVAVDAKMKELLDDMEASLGDGRPFLMGHTYTLADVVGMAFCGRILMVTGDGMIGPKVASWWERMKQRPSFEQIEKAMSCLAPPSKL